MLTFYICPAARASRILAPDTRGNMTDAADAPPFNHPDLTPRLNEVLHLVTQGASDAEIAESLVLTVGTVKNYVQRIRERLDIPPRSERADGIGTRALVSREWRRSRRQSRHERQQEFTSSLRDRVMGHLRTKLSATDLAAIEAEFRTTD